MKRIELTDIKKAYGETVVIPKMSFSIADGERLVLLGPSGCGKSTLLRMIAGLENIQEGVLKISGEDVSNVAPGQRNIAMVFQNYALYPHMTVEDNITYGLRQNKVPKEEVEKRLDMVLDMLDLRVYRKRKPKELSGGQRQRVSLARATVKNSEVFLLDEPLSNLDAQLRVSARQSLLDIHEKFKQTIVYVTHDQIEAMTFATKVILLNKGEIQMYDEPYNVYHHPSNVFTAKFIGSPSMNIMEHVHIISNFIRIGKQRMVLDREWRGYLEENTNYFCGIRPENLRITKKKSEQEYSQIEATVQYIENLGANFAVYLQVEGSQLVAVIKEPDFDVNEKVYIEFLQDHLHFFDGTTEKNLGRPASLHSQRQ
ncbi:ABC transporter ATP-binding protein [Chakrabartyella piscis]|uniref:ABC transporter ATP-binding protein n=1 Tax=Chakrabartyella piscis TaxID=2918914 RepID=UPI002958AEA4|nr:ABC transporter ATP-binding protein [Chakrabartyella piscis]